MLLDPNKPLVRLLPILLLGIPVVVGARTVQSTPPAGATPAIDFARQIRPILADHCLACHGPDGRARQAGLRLDRADDATAPRPDGGTAIVPGAAAQSALIARVSAGADDDRMPPAEAGRRLDPTEIDLLRRWIDEGAVYAPHWGFVAPIRPDPPAVGATAWPRNAVDRFILARLEPAGFAPAPEADRHTLIRRVTLDLTGLPPTPAQVTAFVDDTEPDAYERLVERLLASPHFGERWASVWLDLARYADTKGYEKDARRTMWPYRDWVIDALNRDLPFDAFTIEQIAGDLLPDPSREQLVATAFHRNTMTNDEGGTDDEEFRSAAIVDRVNTTMQAWMGLTIGCAQCHAHKYDPIAHEEYYQLYAFFNNTADRDVPDDRPLLELPTDEQTRERAAIRAVVLDVEIRLAREAAGKSYVAPGAAFDRSLPDELATAQREAARVERQVVRLPVTRELAGEKRRETHVHVRGSFLNKGDPVEPGVPAVLPPLPESAPRDRLALARWLVADDNPLTARVVANRYWEQFFGTGLVETSEDFGTQGALPSHPALLDWLATQLVADEWSLKSLCRVIVTSATYRQTSDTRPALAAVDPYHRLLGGYPRLRLEAEMIRDQVLAASGLLNGTLYGPPVFPVQPAGIWQVVYSNDRWTESKDDDRHRRAIYTFWRRTSPYPSMVTFDTPSREFCVPRRIRTNTPLQALVTLNDPVYVEAAQSLARRIVAEGGARPEERVGFGLALCLARPARGDEVDTLLRLYRSERAHYETHPEAAAALAGAFSEKVAELAAWTVVANVIMNLDEFLTKG